MAFSFGASTSSTPSIFGASSTPAFGAPASTPSLFGGSSTPAFGGSAPAFGAASTPSIFGSTPALGAASTPSLFGGFSSAGSAPSLFGGTSAPAFGTSQPASNAFGFGSSGSIFGATSAPAFGQFGQSQGGFGLGQSAPSTALGLQPQAGGIGTVDNKQLTHYTKWEEINEAGQKQLLEIENKLKAMKESSRQLEQCARLQDSQDDSGTAEEILTHNLKGLASSWISDEDAVGALNEIVHELLHDTDIAVRTFQRSYGWREAAKAGPGQVMMPALREMLSAPVVLPSLYIRKCVAAFQRDVEQYMAMVKELEKLLPVSAVRHDKPKVNDSEEFLRSIPAAMLNMRDLLVHTAAKLEALHTRIGDAKDHFLAQQRSAGNYSNPFQNADRREKHSDDLARKAVTAIPPASGWSQNAGQSPVGQATSSSPSVGAGIFGASASSTSSLFGGQSNGGSIFGQQQAGSMFNELPKAPSRKTRSKK